MQQFAKDSGRPSSRADQKASLKLPTLASSRAPQGQVQHMQSQQQVPVRRQSINNTRGSQHQPITQVKREPFDTDAESIDTTVAHSQKMFDPRHGQYHDGNCDGAYHAHDDESGSGDELDEEEGLDDAYHGIDDSMHYQQQQEVLARMNQGGAGMMFNGDDSYPTTTSGMPEDDPDELQDDQSHFSPTPQPEATGGWPRPQQLGQPLKRPTSAHEVIYPAQNKPSVYQKGAALRTNHRSTTGPGPNQLTGSNISRHVPELQSSQPPSYSQSTRHQNDQVSTDASANLTFQHPPNRGIPQRGAGVGRAAPSATHIQEMNPATIAIVGERGVPSGRNSRQPLSPQSEGGTGSGVASRPIEDYDRPALFDMDYEDLKHEDFDKVPRAASPAFTGDMSHKPLDERLEHVQKELDCVGQAKFFSQLTLAEWEEAGDWFLERFSGIIKHTRAARREKRKLAEEFEHEVEKRHRQVARKRRRVEAALSEMSAQGQTLIPTHARTPGRSSRSPGRR